MNILVIGNGFDLAHVIRRGEYVKSCRVKIKYLFCASNTRRLVYLENNEYNDDLTVK